jgi:hypothetical protein
VNRGLLLRAGIVAGLIAVCTAGFFACFEQREVSFHEPPSIEARRNNYLALGRLLERMGHDVEVAKDLTGLDRLPEPPATVFFARNRAALGEARSQQLLDWVERGGHLVLVTYTTWKIAEDDSGEYEIESGRPDLILDRFGLRQRAATQEEMAQDLAEAALPAPSTETLGEEEGEHAEETENVTPPRAVPPTVGDVLKGNWLPGARESVWATFEEGGEPFEVEFHSGFWWDDTESVATWSVSGERGPHLVEVAHGDGLISALTSDEPLVNDTIGNVENAEFIVRWLRHGRDAFAPVLIFASTEWPSFWQLVSEHGTPALIALAVLIAAWLWRSLVRFGPVLPEPDLARRRWLEHLEAAGAFHWRHDRAQGLLAKLREAVQRELAQRRPGLARLAERERNERLAQASGLPEAEVAHALAGTAHAPRLFVAAVRALARIRAVL